MFKKYISFWFVLAFVLKMPAQELLPFTENFTKSEYAGDNQVWSVAQGADNAMYFANHHYLLRYNGVAWEKYSLPNKTIIRSVYADGGRIYSGSYREYGYWQREAGKLTYTSLSEGTDLFAGKTDNEEVWKIFKLGNTMYFQSFNALYTYDGKTSRKIKAPSLLSYCYVINNTVYAATVRDGVFKLSNNQFVAMDSWPELKGNVVHGIAQNKGRIYVFTKNNGVFEGNESGLKPWNSSINTVLKDNVLLSAKFVNPNLLAVGTSLQGLYLIDLKSHTFKNINRQNALKNNAVLSIATDRENDLWLGLDNGICHIEVNSPVSLFTDNSGLLGSVYSLAPMGSGEYIFVTNHGVFTYEDNAIKTQPSSQGQVWDIYKSGDEFIIGHNDGTFVYNNGALRQVNSINGGWKFFKSEFDDAYFQANYSGIVVYDDLDNLSTWKTLDSIAKPIRNVAQNRAGELWAADNYRSLYRVLYDKDFRVSRAENVSKLNGISNDFGVKLFNFRNEILFFINNYWYEYNRIEGRLEKNRLFNEQFRNISDIVPVDNNNFVVIKEGLLYLITQTGEKFSWNLLSEKYYQGRLILENTKIYKDGDKLLINLDDGFLEFRTDMSSKKEVDVTVEAFYMDDLVTNDTRIKYNQSVDINVISKYYGYSRPDFFYRFNGGPVINIKNGHIILNNLSSGEQKLDIFYNNGNKEIKICSYSFHVARPWYFSMWMILFYIGATALVFFIYYRWNKLRYTQKIRLNEEELKHRREILELELEAENRLRQQEHEKHMLEVEVQTKASEVAGKSLSIAKHSEMIENIQDVLTSENEITQLKSKIKKVIKTSTISKNEWQSFEKNLVKSHEDFVERLTERYPSLTPKDIKLCIYLKMNLSSKEIAPLMNISYRGVELHRYRLRKKLDISSDESLPHFMISL